MTVIESGSLPANPLEALRVLSLADARLEELRREQVAAARAQGCTWDQIGESLGMSRQSAWEYYTRRTVQALDEVTGTTGVGEDEAMRLAVEGVGRVRRRRRHTPGIE